MAGIFLIIFYEKYIAHSKIIYIFASSKQKPRDGGQSLEAMTAEEFYEKEAERLDAERESIDKFEDFIRWCKPEESFKIWSQYVWDMEDTNILYVGRTGEPGCTPMLGYKTEEYDPGKPYVWVSREYREIGSADDFREDILGHRDEVMEWIKQEGGLEAVLHGE